MKKFSIYVLILCMALTMVTIPSFAGDFSEAEFEADDACRMSAPAEEAEPQDEQMDPPAFAEEPNGPAKTAADPAETPAADEAEEDSEESSEGTLPVPAEEESFESAEAVATEGWVTDAEGNRYFLVEGTPVTGFCDIDGSRYYFNEAGIMQTGWVTDENGSRYWFGEDGIMVTGFQRIKSKTYYFNAMGIMQTGLKKIDGTRYYFKPNGPMKTGVVKLNDKMFYFMADGKGVMKKGWFKGIDKKTRYSYGKARIAFGTKKIRKIWYEFSRKNGRLVRRIGDDIDKSIQSKTSGTSWLIILKISEHKVRIYHGKQYHWERAHTFSCTTGASSTPTPRGTYTIKSRGLFFDTGKTMRCWYYTQFYGNYLFHSVLYDRSPTPRHIVDGRLGINASHGCVRLALSNAKWIYQNIPSGTKVTIY